MRRAISAPVAVLAFAVLFAGAAGLLGAETRNAEVDDADDVTQKREAQERKERYTTWMRNFAEETAIRLPGRGDEKPQLAELVPNPVIRYSDEERFIPDATMWVWTRNARPVAFQKVEGNIGAAASSGQSALPRFPRACSTFNGRWVASTRLAHRE
jgi:hypothetical protein